jgi:hypothetical protein
MMMRAVMMMVMMIGRCNDLRYGRARVTTDRVGEKGKDLEAMGECLG